MSKSRSNNPIKRIIFGVIFIILAFTLPWWLVILIGLFLIFKLENFYEYIAAGVILDCLYGNVISIQHFQFVLTLFTAISFFLLLKLKSRLFI